MLAEDQLTAGAGGRGDRARRSGDDKPLGTLFGELVSLVLAYAKQETLQPLKALGRFVAFGVAGAVLLAAGGVLVAIAALRAAQSETGAHLTGELSWVPYVAGVLVALLGATWALTRIGARGRR